MTSFTPGPWHQATKYKSDIYSADGKLVARTGVSPDDADAAHIVRCVNSHAELLEALEKISAFAPGNGEECEIIAKIARIAIAKATA